MKLVTVILPAYNNERFIAEAVESVMGQTYRAIELIIIDDGSTDRTGDISAGYARRHPARIHYLRQDNRGPGAARNLGLRHARGSFIAFLDADDIWLSAKLVKQVGVLERDRSVGLVYCDNYFVDEQRREQVGYRRMVKLHRGNVAPVLFQHYFIITSAVVLRKECVDAIGLFREDIRLGEDYDYFLRLAYRYPVELVREKLYERRNREGSLSNQDYALNATNDIGTLKEFVRQRPGFYSTNRRLVRRRLREYYFALGYYYFRQGRNGDAFGNFVHSLCHGASGRAIKCFCLCFFPLWLIDAVKRSLRPIGEEKGGMRFVAGRGNR
jgi:glycosyltransferase involved in cell wall biosynthesis